jgi:hypothetical protein
MPVVRTLPASLAPRFAGARRAVARTRTSAFELILAERFLLRLRGLTRLDASAMPPLLFPRCRSLHTHWMASAIDVAWLDLRLDDGDATVLGIVEALPPGRWERAGRHDAVDRGNLAALELVPGAAAALGLGEGERVGLEMGPRDSTRPAAGR